MNTPQRSILVLGGYGAVGSATAEELHRSFPGAVLVGGRDATRAAHVAGQLGPRARAVHVDVTESSSLEAVLPHVQTVVNCVEHGNRSIAERCVAHGIHYVDVTATPDVIAELESLEEPARRAGSTVAVSVGIAPGLTNLLTRHAAERLGPLAQVDLTVMLGAGEAHGEAAVRWTLQELRRPYDAPRGCAARRMTPFTEGRATLLPPPFGRRVAYNFNFSDQHTLPGTLGIPTVRTWLCLDSRAMTEALRGIGYLWRMSNIPVPRAARVLARVTRGVRAGSARFALQADARTHHGHVTRDALLGEHEAVVTGRVAAIVASRLLVPGTPRGVRHIEQLLSLQDVLTAMPGALTLYEA